jgi:diguanylate cyclase (GGDEF)-like protein
MGEMWKTSKTVTSGGNCEFYAGWSIQFSVMSAPPQNDPQFSLLRQASVSETAPETTRDAAPEAASVESVMRTEAVDPLTGALLYDAIPRIFSNMVQRLDGERMKTGDSHGVNATMPNHAPSMALLAIRLDQPNGIDDHFGHLQGDEVLREVVIRLTSRLRQFDVLFRRGEYEFVCLVNEVTLALAQLTATRLIDVVAARSISARGMAEGVRCGLNIGVALHGKDGVRLDTLLASAEKRMHAARRRGRNIVVSEDLLEESVATNQFVAPPDTEMATRLIEREPELFALQRFLTKCGSLVQDVGEGRKSDALMIAGSAGAGYSRMAAEARLMAQQKGFRVLSLCGKKGHDAAWSTIADRPQLDDLPVLDDDTHVAALQSWLDDAVIQNVPSLIICDDLGLVDTATRELILPASGALSVPIIFTLPDQQTTPQLREQIATRYTRNRLDAVITLRSLVRNAFYRFLAENRVDADEKFAKWSLEKTGGYPGAWVRLVEALREVGGISIRAGKKYIDASYSRHNIDLPDSFQPHHNIPVPLADLYGRDTDIETVLRRVEDHRLVTLVGPGGVGKTQLAIAVASDLRHRYRDGAWYVELAQVSDRDLMAFTIAKVLSLTLDVRLAPIDSLAVQIRDIARAHERPTEMLLVLDNLEQMAGEAASVISWLMEVAPNITIVCTSRMRLRMQGESLFVVPTLSELHSDTSHDDAGEYTSHAGIPKPGAVSSIAAQLFIARAQAVLPTFSPTVDELKLIESICRKVDGLPLAIELAASRVSTTSIGELYASLESRLSVPGASIVGRNETRHTLRTAIQSSVQLLSEDAAEAFAELAVMKGRWDIVTANAILGRDLHDAVAELVGASLLQESTQKDNRSFMMLETVRDYGLEILVTENKFEQSMRRYMRYVASVASMGEQDLLGATQRSWLDRMEEMSADIRESLRWGLLANSSDCREMLLTIIGAGQLWWELRGHWAELVMWWQRIKPLVETAPPTSTLAAAHVSVARAEFLLARYESCELHYQEGLEIANASQDWLHSAAALTGLGNHANFHRQTDNAITFYTQALARYRGLERLSRVAYCLNTLGLIARQEGDLNKQLQYYLEAAALREQIGDDFGLAQSHLSLGVAYTDLQQPTLALPFIEAAEITLRRYNDSRFLSLHLCMAISTFTQLGDHQRAMANVLEVIKITRATNDRRRSLYLIGAVVRSIAALGDVPFASSLLAAAFRLCRHENIVLLSIEQEHMHADRHWLSQQMSSEQFRAAWREGETWTLDDTLDRLTNATRRADWRREPTTIASA